MDAQLRRSGSGPGFGHAPRHERRKAAGKTGSLPRTLVAEESRIPGDAARQLWYGMFNEKYFSRSNRRAAALGKEKDQNAQCESAWPVPAEWRSLLI